MAAIPSLSLNIPPFFLAEHRQPSNILVKIKKRKKIGVIREEACSVPIVTVFRRRAQMQGTRIFYRACQDEHQG